MTRTAILATALSLTVFFIGQAGFAQETAADADTAEPAPAAESEAVTEDAQPAAPQPGDIVITQHGDWELRCETADNCFMYQLTRDADLNPVAEVSIVALPAGGQAAAGVTIVTPLGTLLSEGVLLQIDGGRAVKYEFGWCTRAGCFARFGLTADELSGMKRGNTARLRIVAVSAPDRPVLLDVSLRGFTAAYDEMPQG